MGVPIGLEWSKVIRQQEDRATRATRATRDTKL
jgi:hypothetical protein